MKTIISIASVIQKIKNLEDEELLETIGKLLEISQDHRTYKLPEGRIQIVEESRKQIANGNYKSQEDFFERVRLNV